MILLMITMARYRTEPRLLRKWYRQAFSFDGMDDFILVPDAPSLNPTNAITLETWVFVTGKQDQHRDIISKDGEGFERQYLLTASDVNRFRAHVGVPDGFLFFDGTTTVELRTWYHIAMTYDRAFLKLYVNGVLDGSMPVTGLIIPTSQPVRIGGGAAEGFDPLHFPGLIDEVALYNRALTAAEIKAIFRTGSAGKCKETEVQKVTIDIKPGSSPNSINPESHGVIPVAILTTDTFNATIVDPLSVEFGPNGATEAHSQGHIEDVNHDGKPDLVLHFKTHAIGIKWGETSASLTGETFDGRPIQGSDAIKTVGCTRSATSILVHGTADLWLAGMPDGSSRALTGTSGIPHPLSPRRRFRAWTS